ncbi:histidine kinase [Mesotoga sp. Brook.08.105.5.1]|uniref:HD domain-containing phosphohydrolase n=1 Tax=Mesotoga sp. Brook.08.105.5.1 TaxID=1421002 RepID=UPI000C1A7BD3|nr:HD domain-containing phosphohydrolase [Mesotoga sp. Brook.08.105.5.1]PNQ05833.1 PAS/PAC sensor protein [Mesotoga sp. SC_NapDC3]PVD15509.1 histidine kinase [Mesotoga sp. Brook.08.105.5.1]PXF35059.1 PAS/PAC sensor protein [Mesotoga sp. SC_NapDC]
MVRTISDQEPSSPVVSILFVEDLVSDAELAKLEITRGLADWDLSLRFLTTDNWEGFLDAISTFKPTLIVSDFMMPGFSGMEVIELTLEHAPNIPVIILTGSINEETAVECMKAGATDYVIKEHISRLPFAVKDAIRRKKEEELRTSAERALEESERKFRLIAEKASDLIYRIELYPEQKFSYVSPSSTKLTGYTPEDHYANPNLGFELVHPDDREKLRDLLEHVDRSPVVLRWIKKNGEVVWAEQLNVPVYDNDGRLIAIEGIARDVTERQKANEALKRAFNSVVSVLSDMLNLKDPYTQFHEKNVAKLALEIAERMGLDEFAIESIRVASMVHDIGKINIPTEILSKPGKLSDIEFEMIKKHPETAYEILRKVDLPWPVADIVYQHHERLDGSGYPRHLKSDEILLEAKIIIVADVIEAMSSHRPYRAALGFEAAIEEIKKNAGVLYDAEIVQICTSILEEGFRF